MLEFYEFNTFNICIVLISTFIIYYTLCKIFQSDKKEDSEFSLEYLLISIIFAVSISLLVSYIISGNDERVLTNSFWDPE